MRCHKTSCCKTICNSTHFDSKERAPIRTVSFRVFSYAPPQPPDLCVCLSGVFHCAMTLSVYVMRTCGASHYRLSATSVTLQLVVPDISCIPFVPSDNDNIKQTSQPYLWSGCFFGGWFTPASVLFGLCFLITWPWHYLFFLLLGPLGLFLRLFAPLPFRVRFLTTTATGPLLRSMFLLIFVWAWNFLLLFFRSVCSSFFIL